MKMKIGVGLLSLLVVGVVGHVGLGAERSDIRPSKQDRGSAKIESNHDLLEQELATLPDGVAVQLTEQAYPEVYEFFRGRIAAKEAMTRSPSKTAGCCDAGSSVRVVQTTGGVLGILENGDGVVHVLAFVIDGQNPDLGDTNGLALSAIITEDGVEIVSMDMDRLPLFVGSEVASVKQDEDDVGGETLDVAIDCSWTSARVCCAVATDSRFCVCCASLSPLGVGCACTPLQ